MFTLFEKHLRNFRAREGPTKPNNRANNTKEFPEQFEGISQKSKGLRQIAPESSPERSAKSLSRDFFVVPFLSLTIVNHAC